MLEDIFPQVSCRTYKGDVFDFSFHDGIVVGCLIACKKRMRNTEMEKCNEILNTARLDAVYKSRRRKPSCFIDATHYSLRPFNLHKERRITFLHWRGL